jgi:hypothetical protein
MHSIVIFEEENGRANTCWNFSLSVPLKNINYAITAGYS